MTLTQTETATAIDERLVGDFGGREIFLDAEPCERRVGGALPLGNRERRYLYRSFNGHCAAADSFSVPSATTAGHSASFPARRATTTRRFPSTPTHAPSVTVRSTALPPVRRLLRDVQIPLPRVHRPLRRESALYHSFNTHCATLRFLFRLLTDHYRPRRRVFHSSRDHSARFVHAPQSFSDTSEREFHKTESNATCSGRNACSSDRFANVSQSFATVSTRSDAVPRRSRVFPN